VQLYFVSLLGILIQPCFPYVGPIIDILHAQICNGDFTFRVKCHHQSLFQLEYKRSGNISGHPWVDSPSC
jgi:hypothetical protein